jgi:hypothetical protein
LGIEERISLKSIVRSFIHPNKSLIEANRTLYENEYRERERERESETETETETGRETVYMRERDGESVRKLGKRKEVISWVVLKDEKREKRGKTIV